MQRLKLHWQNLVSSDSSFQFNGEKPGLRKREVFRGFQAKGPTSHNRCQSPCHVRCVRCLSKQQVRQKMG